MYSVDIPFFHPNNETGRAGFLIARIYDHNGNLSSLGSITGTSYFKNPTNSSRYQFVHDGIDVARGVIDILDPDISSDVPIFTAPLTDYIRNPVCYEGFALGGTSSTVTLASSASGQNDFYKDCVVYIASGNGRGQERYISGYSGASRVITVEPNWSVSPDSSSYVVVRPSSRRDIARWLGDAPLSLSNQRVQVDTGSFSGSASSSISGLQSDISTVLSRIGAFAGSGMNTILGFFRALMRSSSGLTPSDVGGGYDNTTDSLEAIRDTVGVPVDLGSGSTLSGNAVSIYGVNQDIQSRLPSSLDSSGRIRAQVGGYDASLSPGEQVLLNPANKLKTNSDGHVTLVYAVRKGVALPHVVFKMSASGLSVTGRISKDGGAYSPISGTVSEVGEKTYKVTGGLTASEMSADVIALRFSADSVPDVDMIFFTQG